MPSLSPSNKNKLYSGSSSAYGTNYGLTRAAQNQ